MRTLFSPSITRPLVLLAALLLGGCADQAPTASPAAEIAEPSLVMAAPGEYHAALATLRRATARYHDLDVALADSFVFLADCEVREEGAVGLMYVHFARLLDGRADPSAPDALIYEPRAGGRPRLVAAELAIPYALWTESEPPTFLGAEFEREDEFGVYGLHLWLWRQNPDGLFAETNPNVSC